MSLRSIERCVARFPRSALLLACGALLACGGTGSGFVDIPDSEAQDGATQPDSAGDDVGTGVDSTTSDATTDSGTDAATIPDATGDGGATDAAAPSDSGGDGGPDGGAADGGGADAGADSSTLDAASPDGSDASGGADASDASASDAPASDASDGATCTAPAAGVLYVAPTGSDTTGNGSSGCPFVTITKALSMTVGASGVTTIVVASGTSGTPFVYGTGCTAGGSHCDAVPIVVTPAMSGGLLIEGTSSDPNATVVAGGSSASDTAVFTVNAPYVGFRNLTVAPKRVATGAGAGRVAGAVGIRFRALAVAAGPEGAVTNVVVSGVSRGNTTESTGSGIEISGGTSPQIGPGVTVVGGDHSVLVTQAASGTPAASKPTITSSVAAPSFFHSAQFACVRVESTNAGAAAMPTATLTATSSNDPGRLHLQDCGGNGAVVVDTVSAGTAVDVTDTLIDTSSVNAPAYYGIQLVHAGVLTAGTEVTVTATHEVSAGVGAGIEAGGTSLLTITPSASASLAGVLVTRNFGSGVHVTGNAVAVIDGLLSSINGRSGLVCDAAPATAGATNLTLRNSSLLSNSVHGAFITGAAGGSACVADLGSPSAAGNNVFNRTSKVNGHMGLCYLGTTAASATGSTWGCGLSAATACTPATGTTPAPLVVASCDLVGDSNTSAMLTVALPQTCCGL
jgi:hypothetical protein